MAVSLTVLAFALHASSVLTRGLSAGRPPWGNMFEFSTTGALAVTGVFLVLLTRKDVRYLGTFVILPVLLTLGLAVAVLYTESAQLVPALKSVWLLIHVTAAIIASGIFTIGFCQSICYLVQERRERVPAAERVTVVHGPAAAGRRAGPVGVQDARLRLPDLDLRGDRRAPSGRRTRGAATGAGTRRRPGRSSPGWSTRATCTPGPRPGWKGRRAAYLAGLGYATFLFNYLVVNIWLVGFHSYAGVG